MDFPPIFIQSGKYAGQGIIDYQMKIYEKELKEYEHKIVPVSPQRIHHMVLNTTDDLYCIGNYLDVPGLTRNKEYLASDTIYTVNPNRLIIQKKNIKKILNGQTKLVSLEELVKKQKFKLGYMFTRPYGGTVDKILTKNEKSPFLNGLKHAGQTAVLKMLDAGRIDMALGYMMEANYFYKNDLLKNELVTIPLKEDQSYYEYFVACNKHPEAKAFINKINKVIKKYKNDPTFYQGFTNWYSTEGMVDFKKRNGV